MKMILKQIQINNFKGCKERIIDFSKKTNLKGQNGSGKTTIADAFSWVLFNKDSSGSAQFDIRPKDELGVDIDFVDTQVKLQLEIDSKPIEVIKTQKQKWVKKRGSEEKTFEGNENLYEVNTIPKSEKEFKAYIEAIVPEEVFKFVSNTSAFMSQKPNDRRETLFKLVSEVTDEDILATDEKLRNGLSDQLAQFTADEIMSRDAKALKEYKKKLEEIPTRIDEVSKTIVEVDYSERENQVLVLKKQLEEIEEEISNSSNGYEEINRLKNEIAELKDKISDIERAEKKKIQDKRYNIKSKADDTDHIFNNLLNDQKRIERDLELKKSDIVNGEDYLAKLGNDYKTEKVKELDQSTTICPTCHQGLPSEMKDKLVEDFNSSKDAKLLLINNNGKSVADSVKKLKTEIPELEKQLEQIKADKVAANGNQNKLMEELAAMPTEIDLSDNQEYESLNRTLLTMNSTLESLINQSADDVKQTLLNRKREIQIKIDTVNAVISNKIVIEKAKVRVEELKAEQKQLSQDIATVEKEIYLLEEFNKAKVNLLSEKINQHFKVVKWKLFERQINGGYKPVCEPLVNGQSYSSGLNSGHKILAELDIINTLQEIYEVNVPVFLDNAERVNDYNIPEVECQLITLSVTDNKELKVEVM